MSNHSKIHQIKERAAAINYSSVSVNEIGQLTERESLLDKRIVEGYGCIWGKINDHNERHFKGCWARSIRENGPGSGAAYEIKFRDEHGRACALFEELREDDLGLYFRTKPLDDVGWCDDLLVQLRSKTINNFSDGFQYVFSTEAMKWNEADQCIDIFEGKLLEISATAIPSDRSTFAIRSIENADELFDQTEDFIKSLPRKDQLRARHLFALHKSPTQTAPLEQRNTAPEQGDRPVANRVDYQYLLNNLKS
jgi:HK97 family phage prohead protease